MSIGFTLASLRHGALRERHDICFSYAITIIDSGEVGGAPSPTHTQVCQSFRPFSLSNSASFQS